MDMEFTIKHVREILVESKMLMPFLDCMKECEEKEGFSWENEKVHFYYKCLAQHYDKYICRVVNFIDNSYKDSRPQSPPGRKGDVA